MKKVKEKIGLEVPLMKQKNMLPEQRNKKKEVTYYFFVIKPVCVGAFKSSLHIFQIQPMVNQVFLHIYT